MTDPEFVRQVADILARHYGSADFIARLHRIAEELTPTDFRPVSDDFIRLSGESTSAPISR